MGNYSSNSNLTSNKLLFEMGLNNFSNINNDSNLVQFMSVNI
jgi:hypothetical protein